MLPSLGFQEIVLLCVIALLVVGPKDLPLLFRKVGRWTARIRGMAQEFRSGFDELARQAELDELKREVEKLRQTSGLQDIGRELSTPPSLETYAGVTPTETPPADAPVAPTGEAAADTGDVYPPSEHAEEPAPRAVEHASADRKP